MANKGKWSIREDNVIINNYPSFGIQGCIDKLDRTKKSIVLRARKLNIKKLYNGQNILLYKKENLEELIKNSSSFSEIARKVNMSPANAYTTIKKYAIKFNIDFSHFTGQLQHIKNLSKSKQIPLSEILIENSSYSRKSLKKRLINDGLLKEKCVFCSQENIWFGKRISLILDHINGIRNDNRLENLRLLCPNCNASLETHAGKNNKNKIECQCVDCGKKIYKNSSRCRKCYNNINGELTYNRLKKYRKNRPPLKVLLKYTKEIGFVKTGEKYNVSDNCIRKWIKNYQKYNDL